MRFQKINKQRAHTYPRIEFGFASIALRNSLKLLLVELGFRLFIWKDNASTTFKLCISGEVMLQKWMKEIQPKNPKHLKKYDFWRVNGFYTEQ